MNMEENMTPLVMVMEKDLKVTPTPWLWTTVAHGAKLNEPHSS